MMILFTTNELARMVMTTADHLEKAMSTSDRKYYEPVQDIYKAIADKTEIVKDKYIITLTNFQLNCICTELVGDINNQPLIDKLQAHIKW